MATYLMLFSFTQKGIEKIKEIGARVEAARQIIHQRGGELQTFYGILGSEFDTLFILTAPSDEKVAEMALAIGMLGNVRTRTHRLLSSDEVSRITAALP